jgi:non-canonical (house-cleaning) NTP pyrophosphatase
MYNYAWVFIKNRENKLGKSKTDTFVLPSRVRELILEGKELGKADDIVFGHTNSKQTIGSIGILTNNLITRTSYYTEAIILALIPFMNSELY